MKKRKLHFWMFNDIGIEFYACGRMNYHGVKGGFYKTQNLTEEQKEKILAFQNTEILRGCKEYAPEITFYVIFVADKCFNRLEVQ